MLVGRLAFLLPKLRLFVTATRFQSRLVLGRCQRQTISFSFYANLHRWLFSLWFFSEADLQDSPISPDCLDSARGWEFETHVVCFRDRLRWIQPWSSYDRIIRRGLIYDQELHDFCNDADFNRPLIVPKVMLASPESPTTGFGSSMILDVLISIISRVFLKMILAEIPVSTNILATSIFLIFSLMTRRSLRGLTGSVVALSLKEMTSLHVWLGISCVSCSVIFELENLIPPPSSAKLW